MIIDPDNRSPLVISLFLTPNYFPLSSLYCSAFSLLVVHRTLMCLRINNVLDLTQYSFVPIGCIIHFLHRLACGLEASR